MSGDCETRFRVRYAETDQMGVVYYANYFVWMEIGRTDFCRMCGFSYIEFERDEKAFIAVAEATCRYIASARYDDEILLRTSLERVGRRVIAFTYSILNGETGVLLAEGKTVHVVVGLDGKPKAISDRYFQALSAQTKGSTPQPNRENAREQASG
jgi:acyl-CoA thioester hydrolase